MKAFIRTSIIGSLIAWLGFNVIAQPVAQTAAPTADQDVASGLAYLAAQNLAAANQQFTSALAVSPTNESANLLAAATRLLVLPNTPAGSNFLTSLGFPRAGRNLYSWTSFLPTNASGNTVLPANNTAVAIAFYRTNVMAALAASRTNLARITDPNFTLSLTAEETSLEAVTVDYGDILLLQALERMAEFKGYTASAQNLEVVPSALQALGNPKKWSLQEVLSMYPKLLTLSNPGDLAASKGALTNAAALYFAASDFIRNVRAPGAPALFVLSDDATNDEAIFRTELTNALLSLNGPVTFAAPDPVTINASNYFAGTKTLRSLLPQFNGEVYVPDSLPDYTFGGILVDEPTYLTEEALRGLAYSYAGIYAGQIYDLSYNDSDAGNFAVFVGPNQQVTVVGGNTDTANDFNNSGQGFTQYGGIGAQFYMDRSGNWQFDSNKLAGVSGYGSFGKDGSFSGELDFTNGDSVWLTGNQQSVFGSVQNAAGLYSGPVTSSSGVQVGTVQSVLSADGSFTFCAFFDGRVQNDGGQGQVDSNDHLTFTSVNGATGSGTLNTSTFQITGKVISSGGTRSYTLSRSAKVPFDLPPAITKNLPANLTAQLGTNLMLSVTATGSAPLWYQWYSNSVAIPFANSNTLVLNKLQFNGAGAYSVAIDNVGGETNSSLLNLAVVPSPFLPTNQITAPTPGQPVSNALYTVTGKAGDKVAVSNVLVQVNSGGWNSATTTNQWATWMIQVPLIAGSNTVQAYAVDTSGNISRPTNAVSFTYVPSALLTVLTSGLGSLAPNYNGVPLQVGKNYSIIATPAKGFAFNYWSVGAFTTNHSTLTFTMASNLVITAYFKDVTPPTNVITAPTPGQQVSNAFYTVTGKASDLLAVSNVLVQVNGGGWNPAITTNQWTNWTIQVPLIAGSNTVQAYAVDTSGNFSKPTNTVKFDYVMYAPLTVIITNGYGTLTPNMGSVAPNYNGVPLQISNIYSITATPAKGFAFVHWTIGTFMTNKSTLTFTMASNLVIYAYFKDATPPTNEITFPVANQKYTNYVITVTGKAGDNVGVVGVGVQINNGGWLAAQLSNGFTNWTAVNLPVAFGTNIVQAYAQDAAGNESVTNVVKFIGVPPPVGMALIPAGTFTMGDTLDGEGDATPVSVYVSAFYMDTNLVSYSQWQLVCGYATNHGYNFANAGAGKAANHPVYDVDWFDCVKWCNARSQQAGLAPVYYLDAGLKQVYTNGEPATVYANWSAKGYRLPTEAEWEKAARGGLSGQRFPWGITISESQANYDAQPGSYFYDLAPYSGSNPDFEIGDQPYTSPVGSFAPNGYGLYDMAGNMSQRCWDWYGTYAGGSDPHGPTSGSLRVFRGGCWGDYAYFCRTANRSYFYRDYSSRFIGFRSVLPAGR